MKTNSPELFDLIKSLSKQEKKRIRKELSLNTKDRKSLILYDIINKQMIFSDEKVQDKLGYPKWYPQLKKQLLEKITDKVFSGHYDRKEKAYIFKLIILADRFKAKGLTKQAQKKLELASVICKKNEWVEYMPIINTKLIDVMKVDYSHVVNYSFYPEAYKVLNQSYLEKKYSILFCCLEFSGDSADVAKVINDLRTEEFLADEKYLTTLSQKINYYLFLAVYYKNIKFDYPQNYFYCKKYLETVILGSHHEEGNNDQDSDKQRYIREDRTIMGLYNVITTAIFSNALVDLDEQFRSFIQLERKFKIGKTHPLKTYYTETLQLTYFKIAMAKITRKGLESSNFSLYHDQYCLLRRKLPKGILVPCDGFIAFYLFMKKSWNDCSSYVNKILNDNEAYKSYTDVYANMLLLQLFVNYETDDLDVLDYNIKKTERYFEKYYSALSYEKIILSFFNEIVINNYTNSKIVMNKYKNKLSHLLLNDSMFSVTYLTEREFIDFESWLDSKITNRPFLNVLREKAEKKDEIGSLWL